MIGVMKMSEVFRFKPILKIKIDILYIAMLYKVFASDKKGQHIVNSRVPTRGTFPARNLCGCGLERGSAQDPPRGTLSSGSESPPAEEEVF